MMKRKSVELLFIMAVMLCCVNLPFVVAVENEQMENESIPPPPPREREKEEDIGQDPLRGPFNATTWESNGDLAVPRVLSSVVFFNKSFIIVGGCMNMNCSDKSKVISVYDPFHLVTMVGRYVPLPFGIAGPRTTVVVAGAIYVIQMCSMILDGDFATLNRTNFRNIMKLDPDTGAVNDTYLTIPDDEARANASCVGYGNRIYIIGGIKLYEKGFPVTAKIAMFDLVTNQYTNDFREYGDPVMSSAVSEDSSAIYAAGGLDGNRNFLRNIWVYFPAYSCGRYLASIPNNIPQSDITLSVYAGYLVIADVTRTLFAIYDMPNVKWNQYNMTEAYIHEKNKTTNNTKKNGGQNQGVNNFNFTQQSFSSWAAIPHTSNTSGAMLRLYQFGGVVPVYKRKGDNQSSFHAEEDEETIVGYDVIMNISTSLTNIRVPVAMLPSKVVETDQILNFQLGGNVGHRCNEKTSSCSVRLSQRIDCEGHACSTTDTTWRGEQVGFLPYGTAFPVYVCFSFGNTKIKCDAVEMPTPFYVTDVFQPLNIVDNSQVTTPAPTPIADNSNVNMLFYILGAVACVTTLIAVLLVAKLRKVPEDGILSRAVNPISYGTSQEERYKFIAKIGEGAFSIVYLVVRRADGRRFALKHMECQSDEQRQDAIKECEIMRTLQGHPNVINLVDMFMNYEFDMVSPDSISTDAHKLTTSLLRASGRQDSLEPRDRDNEKGEKKDGEESKEATKRSRHLCLVMEYHEAGDLKRWVSQLVSHPSEALLCSIASQVCAVLVHCHSQVPPVIHRDLKPENILVTVVGQPHPSFIPVVVTDFGLARLQDEPHLQEGAGTLPYVAPECFQNRYNTQCDMWSLGSVLYALGVKRVRPDNVRLLFEECNKKPFHQWIESDLLRIGYSKTFSRFILLLLIVDPEDRLSAKEAHSMFRCRKEVLYLSERSVNDRWEYGKPVTSPIVPPLPKKKFMEVTTAVNGVDNTASFMENFEPGSPINPDMLTKLVDTPKTKKVPVGSLFTSARESTPKKPPKGPVNWNNGSTPPGEGNGKVVENGGNGKATSPEEEEEKPKVISPTKPSFEDALRAEEQEERGEEKRQPDKDEETDTDEKPTSSGPEKLATSINNLSVAVEDTGNISN